jgi:phage-related tail fiber protein
VSRRHLHSRQRSGWLLAFAATLALGQADAQSGGDYDLVRSVIGAGGGRSADTQYQVDGSIGQSATAELAGGDYRLRGGFWVGAAAGIQPETMFADGFE